MKLPVLFFIIAIACNSPQTEVTSGAFEVDTNASEPDTKFSESPQVYSTPGKIETGKVSPLQILAYAETLVGTPYLYGSSDKDSGFDCSGFITHVFNHFKVAVPRSSIDFTNIESEIPAEQAQPGDLILFTGTDSLNPVIGHMGIIYSVSDTAIGFIHSTSGKANGVTITPLNDYYRSRFVKIIRVFKKS